MTILTEKIYPGEFILSEAPGKRSRIVGIVAASQTLLAGSLIAKVLTGALTVTATPGAGNTGNGAIGTVTADAGAPLGNYTVIIIEPTTNLGTFQVTRPDGTVDGTGVVGTAYNGGINFTLADGATDFAAGDHFTVNVAQGAAVLQIKKFNPAGTDGTQIPGGIAFAGVVTGADETAKVVIIDTDAEVNGNLLDYGSTDAAVIAAANAGLLALGIKVRT